MFDTGTKHDMKKLITSAGLVCIGAASLEAQQVYAPAPQLTETQLAKPWSVAAAVRGFYDDNYALVPRNLRDDSFGWEVSPSAGLNYAMEQTYIGLSYVYGLRYFESRRPKTDQSHQANIKLSHAFTDRYKLDLANSFVRTREPNLVAPGFAAPLGTIRTEGDVWRNHGTATFTAGLTDQLSAVLGYANTLFDYDQTGAGSRSALLDRMEHLGTANLRWQVHPSTVALVGYQFGLVDYTANLNTLIPYRGTFLRSGDRDNTSHYAYVGADHTFNQQLDASIRAGAQFTIFDDLPGGDYDTVTPYVDGNVTYRLTPQSYVQVGARHSRLATDAAALDQESTTVYSSINYRVLPQMTASLLGQFQHNEFEEGQFQPGVGNFRNRNELFWLAGVNLAYEINRFLAAEVGYNYDRLDSDLGIRSFTRNRVYVGLRASY
jgi:hypothetical protein